MKYLNTTISLLLLALFTGCGDDEFSARHNQGKNCLECHSFTSGATIFSSLHAADYDETKAVRDVNIRLLLANGQTVTYSKGNGYGNYKYSGDRNALDAFTPQVIDANGTVLNQSMRPHGSERLACNRCHTQEGVHGAPGRIVSYDLSK